MCAATAYIFALHPPQEFSSSSSVRFPDCSDLQSAAGALSPVWQLKVVLKVVKRNSKLTNLCIHICVSYWWLTLMYNLVYIQKSTNSHHLCLLLTLSLYEMHTSAVKDSQHVSRQKSMKLYHVHSKRSFRPNPPRI